MHLFLDSTNHALITYWKKTGIIDGITTNPTLFSKTEESPLKTISSICSTMDPFPVSVQVTEQDPDNIYAQAKRIAAIADNIVVKIPCLVEYYAAIQKLVQVNIPVNITLVFSLGQALAMYKLKVTYISPFIGRLDDINSPGVDFLKDCIAIKRTYNFSTQVLAASLRTVGQLHDVVSTGTDCATVPPELLEKALHHPLTDQGIEKFRADWHKLNILNFP